MIYSYSCLEVGKEIQLHNWPLEFSDNGDTALKMSFFTGLGYNKYITEIIIMVGRLHTCKIGYY